MGAFADRAKNTATRGVNKYGNAIILVEKYDCVYDPNLGEDVCSERFYSMDASISNFAITAGDTTVNVGDLRALVSVGFEISKTWVVQYAGKDWQIIDVVITTTQDEIITQALQIRA